MKSFSIQLPLHGGHRYQFFSSNLPATSWNWDRQERTLGYLGQQFNSLSFRLLCLLVVVHFFLWVAQSNTLRKSTSEDESEEVRKMQVSWLRCGWVGSMLTMVIRIRGENWSLTCSSCFLGCWDVGCLFVQSDWETKTLISYNWVVA